MKNYKPEQIVGVLAELFYSRKLQAEGKLPQYSEMTFTLYTRQMLQEITYWVE